MPRGTRNRVSGSSNKQKNSRPRSSTFDVIDFRILSFFVAENGFCLDRRRLIEIKRRRQRLLLKTLQSIKSRRVMLHVCETRARPLLCLRKFLTSFWSCEKLSWMIHDSSLNRNEIHIGYAVADLQKKLRSFHRSLSGAGPRTAYPVKEIFWGKPIHLLQKSFSGAVRSCGEKSWYRNQHTQENLDRRNPRCSK